MNGQLPNALTSFIWHFLKPYKFITSVFDTHAELLAHGELYKALWDVRMGGFLQDKPNEDA